MAFLKIHAAHVTALSSAAIRVLAYVFFRWIPGHQLPPLIYSAGVIYVTSYLFTPICRIESMKQTVRTKWLREGNYTGPEMYSPKEQNDEPLGMTGYQIDDGHENHESETPTKILDPASRARYASSSRVNVLHTVFYIIRTLVLGLPSPQSTFWGLVTLSINLLLVLGVLDVVYRGPTMYPSHDLSFSRVGYVSNTSAKILIREPNVARSPVYVSYREACSESDQVWVSAGVVYSLSNDTDFASTVTMINLQPSTKYEYAVSNNHRGSFTTGPPAGLMAPKKAKYTFLTSSCIKPRFPYNPFDHPLTIPGLKHLAKWIPQLDASFMLFLGDFIYIDVPHRFGTDVETYRREYRQVYASPDWPAFTSNLPWIHVIDDHEIANDWDKRTADPYPAAIDPWDIYHGSANPPPALPNASYYQFTQGPASFFMLDTRRHRDPESPSPADSQTKSMLGATQLASLLAFLTRDEAPGVKWKFIISSIPFTRNWRINAADTWANYLHERRLILEAMWDVSARGDGIGVVVLSGDRHEFAATAFRPPRDGKWPASATVHEFSTSPLSMFYLPFRSYWEVPGEDDFEEICIRYAPDGNSKFGAIELEESSVSEQGMLRFRLFVDGIERWDYQLTTPPVTTITNISSLKSKKAQDAMQE